MKENSLKIKANSSKTESQHPVQGLKEGLFVKMIMTNGPVIRTIRIETLDKIGVSGNLLSGDPVKWSWEDFKRKFIGRMGEDYVLKELIEEFKKQFSTPESGMTPKIYGISTDGFDEFILKDYGTPYESLMGYAKKAGRTICLYKSGKFAQPDTFVTTTITTCCRGISGGTKGITVSIPTIKLEECKKEIAELISLYAVQQQE